MMFRCGSDAQTQQAPIRPVRDTNRLLVQERHAMTQPSTSGPVDRRSIRTRNALREALIQLIGERGWDAIAVQDLCERANVGRSTFYSHFPNKDALLLGGLEDLRVELGRQATLRSPAKGGSSSPGFRFSLGLIEHAHQQRKVFRGLIGRRSGYVVQQRFREMVVRLIDDELPPSKGRLPKAAIARALAAAFVELLAWWVEQRSPMPPAELALRFDELSQPFVKSGSAQPA